MAEEMLAKCIDSLKKQYNGSDKEALIRGVFMDAYKLGNEAGFNAGYKKAVSDVESFQCYEDDDISDESSGFGFDQFDGTEEMFN